eukprot:GFUD01132274.1.p1 GENE.GFUD01132274.1~~GFUD01132274.1.p1  ORF type:complete len:178 (-),score=42.72 GFUD01132274.1:153-686(-)
MTKYMQNSSSMEYQHIYDAWTELNIKKRIENEQQVTRYVKYVKDHLEKREYDEYRRDILETSNQYKKDDLKDLREIYKERHYKTLLDIIKEDEEGDLFIVNTDHELTETIGNTFEMHNCKVTVTRLERGLLALYVLLNKEISMKKLRKLVEKGNKFGLEFFLTKTGITTSLMYQQST